MRGRRPRAGTLKGEAHGPQETQGPPAGAWETSWRLWGPGPGPHQRRPAPGDPAPPPARHPPPGASPGTPLLCRKDTLRMTASRVFSSPSFVPLLAAFMSCVIWAEAEGLVRDAGRAWGPPPPPRATGLGYTRGEPRAAPPPGCWQRRPRVGPPQGLQRRGSRRGGPPWGHPLRARGFPHPDCSPGVQLRTRCDMARSLEAWSPAPPPPATRPCTRHSTSPSLSFPLEPRRGLRNERTGCG